VKTIPSMLLKSSLLALALAGSACGLLKKKADPAPAATAPAAASTTAAAAVTNAPAPAAAPPAEVPDEAIATSEDFEDEAFAKISDKTYKTDLEALKKEIEAP
jgi:hypothetical protein